MTKTKTTSQKVSQHEKAECDVQMKGQDKTPENNQKKWRQATSRKSIQDDSEGDSGSRKKNGGKDWEDARNVYQRHRITKEQTEMNNTLEGIHSRTTESEERINDPEDRMVEITAAEQNIEKRMKGNEDSLRNL